MSEPTDTQESFMSHLIELRSRLMRSIIAVVIVVVALFPFAKDIYAALAQPLLRVLPQGSTMIATDVTGTKATGERSSVIPMKSRGATPMIV